MLSGSYVVHLVTSKTIKEINPKITCEKDMYIQNNIFLKKFERDNYENNILIISQSTSAPFRSPQTKFVCCSGYAK